MTSSSPNNQATQGRETVQDLFIHAVREHRDRKLILSGFDGSVFTFGDAAEVVQRVMAKLSAEGVRKGDKVCAYAPVQVESFLLFWAVAGLGAIFVPIDHNASEKALARILGQIKPSALFCDRKRFDALSTLKDRVKTIVFDDQREDAVPGALFFSEWIEGPPAAFQLPEVSSDDPVLVIYTSGTTGDPKGIVLSNASLYRFGKLMNGLFALGSDDVVLSHGDMHSTGGLRSTTAALHAGYSFLVLPLEQRANIFSVVDCIRKYRCTQLNTTPMTIRHLVEFKDRICAADLGSLRSIVSAGSFLAQHLMDEVYEQYHVPSLNCYGLTETMGTFIGNSRDSFKQAQGSVGLPLAGFDVEIVDDAGKVLPAGAPGELRVRNNSTMMSGYFQNPELTAQVIRDGWLYTGDLAKKRADGHIVLTGRIKNIIKQANGDYICPEEVELALEKHPCVREAAVCGFTSQRGDERLAAFIVSKVPVQADAFFGELRQHIKDDLGSHKVPAVFFLKEALPRGGFGKVMREQLRREIVDPGIVPQEGANQCFR